MSTHSKQAAQLARQLFKLSLEDGLVAPERVAGVLEYLEKHRPANPILVLKAYHRLIANELGRSEAHVEHAGALPNAVLQALTASLSTKYGRRVTASAAANPALIAGLRVRVGDDLYESSIAGQLSALAEAV